MKDDKTKKKQNRKKIRHSLKALDEKSKVYARPDGWHYHLRKDCPMLQGGDFMRLKYADIRTEGLFKRRLTPCACCYDDFKPRKLKQGNILVGIYKFFIPKDFKGEVRKGMAIGKGYDQSLGGNPLVPVFNVLFKLAYGAGKLLRKIVGDKKVK